MFVSCFAMLYHCACLLLFPPWRYIVYTYDSFSSPLHCTAARVQHCVVLVYIIFYDTIYYSGPFLKHILHIFYFEDLILLILDSHGMFLFVYNLQESSGIFTFMIFSVQIGKINV